MEPDGNIIHGMELAEAFELDIHDFSVTEDKPLKMAEASGPTRSKIKLLMQEARKCLPKSTVNLPYLQFLHDK